jgi:polar amino acid transport system substrate-binding protein
MGASAKLISCRGAALHEINKVYHPPPKNDIMNRKALFLVLISIAVLAVSFAGCSSDTVSPGGDSGTIEETIVYTVGIDVPYPPFSMMDEKGKPIGFDVESIEWIAQDQGFEVEFKTVAWDGIIPALQAGQIDMIYSGMTITEERAEKVSFSFPYWTVNQDVVAAENSDVTIEDVLAGNTLIGTQRGCTAGIWVEENLIEPGTMPKENLKLYDNTPLAVNDLESGRIDVVMYDDLVLKDIVEGKPVKTIGFIETQEQFGIAVRQDDTDLLAALNDGLSNLMNDPYWGELQDKYNMR